jgi:carbon starvation protein CstA
VATLFPVDKIIGKIYPVFGICLLIMAFGIMIMIMSNSRSSGVLARAA